MADWNVIRQLAADFQRIQATSTTQKLSERNCIELVNKLIEFKLINVIYTLDGKEYITDKHLEKEVLDELVAHGGRINVVDLQQILNVDLNYIEAKISELLKQDKSLLLVQGFLINRTYLAQMCEEINDTLQEAGQLTVSDLTKEFGLPTAFLLEHIEASLGISIMGRLDKTDSGVLYTDAYVARYQARIRGQFSAITKPTPLGPVISLGNYHSKLFHSVLNELISTGQLLASIHGRMEKAVYIPDVYIKLQNSWVDSFLASNGYLEYDAIARLGIENPQEYLNRRYADHTKLLKLETCCVGHLVQTRVEAALEEVQSSNGWVDIMTMLPSPCTPADGNKILQAFCKSSTDMKVFGMTAVASKAFIQASFELFQPMIAEKAQKLAAINPAVLTEMVSSSQVEVPRNKKEERRKRGGTERKGQQRGKVAEEEDDGEGEGTRKGNCNTELQFMTVEEITSFLSTKYTDCAEDFIAALADCLFGRLQDAYQQAIRALVSTFNPGPRLSQQRKQHANLQESVQGLWNSAKLFQKAIQLFNGDAQLQLSKYLLRTVCSDLLNMVLSYLSKGNGVQLPDDQKLTAKDRVTIIASLPEDMRKSLKASNVAVNGKDVDEFMKHFEAICEEEFCGVMLKKSDKKKERQLVFSHQQSLIVALKEETEPAMALHLAAVLLFQRYTGCTIHAPGRLVPAIVSFLAQHMSDIEYIKLTDFQRKVMLHMKMTKGNNQDDELTEGTHGTEGEQAQTLESTVIDDPESDPTLIMDELITDLDKLKDLAIKQHKENE